MRGVFFEGEKRMKLSVRERVMMSQLFPALVPETANRHFYALIDELAKDLSLTEKEADRIEFKQAGEKYKDEEGGEQVVPKDQVLWNPQKEFVKNVDIPKVLNDAIIKTFQEKDAQGELGREMIVIFDRFVKEEEWHKDKE